MQTTRIIFNEKHRQKCLDNAEKFMKENYEHVLRSNDTVIGYTYQIKNSKSKFRKIK